MPLCGTAYLTKKENPTIAKIFIYKYRGGSCVLLYTNARVITHYISMARTIYNAISGNRAGICQNHSFGDGCVFCCHSHSPLSGADTACLGLWYSNTHPPWRQHTIPPLVWTHEIVCGCKHWSFCNAQHRRCGGRWICITAAKTWARQAPLERQPACFQSR